MISLCQVPDSIQARGGTHPMFLYKHVPRYRGLRKHGGGGVRNPPFGHVRMGKGHVSQRVPRKGRIRKLFRKKKLEYSMRVQQLGPARAVSLILCRINPAA